MVDPERIPVIVAVGEKIDRPANAEEAMEPVALMAAALRACEADAGRALLDRVDLISLIGLVSWRYQNPVALLCETLGLSPAEQVNASMGGETPVRLVHEAAVRIAAGEPLTAAIVGGEASSSRAHARKSGARLPWTPAASREQTVRFPSSRFAMSAAAKRLGVTDPAQIYPFYEVAAQAAWHQSPAQGRQKSAALWARYAKVAASNPAAWIRSAPEADAIAAVGPDNRMINWPYTKLMTANPSVNQAAAVIVTSLATARALGVDEDRLIHIWGGAAANEPEDYLLRDRYDQSTAQAAVLKRAVELAGGDARAFDHMELYSCFPIVPKMALRTLGLSDGAVSPTVAGGLTFFGGPLNNYMGHGIAAMVRTLRADPGSLGLLYGQGGYVNKHHALLVSTTPPEIALAPDYSVQAEADAARGPTPTLLDAYDGPATIETYTVTYARDGEPLQGVVIARTVAGERIMTRVPPSDRETLDRLLSDAASAVGVQGHVHTDVFGKSTFNIGEARRERERRSCLIERDGPLTIVTINRPAAMNALDPDTNAELAEIFDAFAADPAQWVAIITGAGDRAFSSGNDLKETARRMGRGEPLETPTTGFAGLTARFDLNKPVIAAVNGVAMGGGFEVALACDLIIASETAAFALPEPKVGLAALAGGLLRLPQQIGLKKAMGMILTGRRVSAAEGLALGFVNEVVPADDLMATARRWANEIIAVSPMSIRASKEIVRKGAAAASVQDAYAAQTDYPAVRALFRSADVREGPLAFAQKRPPRWSGR
ncbi:enoyl-CoA hydratase-related protein [Brevundimonas vesicularis]|nr:enoyl-CoA hydratase-related protein [Brevundimonas vesicularis]